MSRGNSIAVGCDHAGFDLKREVVGWLSKDFDVIDCGTYSSDAVDYPDFAALVGRAVVRGDAQKGIVVCGSGAGACVAANKLRGVRAAQASEPYTARQCVEHDDVNVLCLGARTTGIEVAKLIVGAFVSARFSGEDRHVKRLNKVLELEREGQ